MPLLLSFICLLFPVPSLPFALAWWNRTRRPAACAMMLAMAFGAVSLSIGMPQGSDLARYVASASSYQGAVFGQWAHLDYAEYPVTAAVFWLIANTFGAKSLPFFVGAIAYGLSFYVIFDFVNRERLSSALVALALFAAMAAMPILGLTNAVRSSLAMPLVVLALYRDVYKGRLNALTVVLYLAPGLIHAVGYIGIALRLLLVLCRNRRIVGLALCFAGIPLLLVFADWAASTLTFLNADVFGMLTEYSEWTDMGWAAAVAASRLQWLYRALNVSLCLALSCVLLHRDRSSSASVETLALMFLGTIAGFAAFITVPSYLRFSYAFLPFAFAASLSCLGKGRAELSARSTSSRASFSLFLVLMVCAFAALFAVYSYQLVMNIGLETLARALLLGVTTVLIG